jgi:DNA replication protein DnaC
VSFERKPICDLDPYVLRHVQEFVRRIGENVDAGRGMWFYGDVGTGKTSLAMLVSGAAEEAERSVAIYPMTRLLAEIKETYDRDTGESYMQFFRRLCAVDLLHIDDLGAERTTEWVLEQLYSIVNERWQDQRSIVVTTNITSLDRLRDQVGARTVSRLSEICGDPIPIMGPDLRMTAGA